MTAHLHLVRLTPEMAGVAAWAHQHKLVGRGGDLGYALHALLAATFGAHAPRPFRLHETRPRGSSHMVVKLYGYCEADEATLRDCAALAEPEVTDILGLNDLRAKAMPGIWAKGRRLGFEARVRPVVRQDRPGNRGAARERDSFLVACDAAGPDHRVERAKVYAAWFKDHLTRAGGAQILQRGEGDLLRLAAFRRTRVRRPGKDRKPREVEGPDAVLTGALEVTDGPAFETLLRRGIGRHRAFGFGMLLLRPPPSGTELTC